MSEKYLPNQMRPVTDALTMAQHAIEAMIVKGDEENIFDYRNDHPELYRLYMDINNLACTAFDMYDN